MSDIEDDLNDINFFEEEEEDYFIDEQIKKNILIKNIDSMQENNLLMEYLKKYYENLGFKDNDLIKKIEKCLIYNILDFQDIKNIAAFLGQFNSSNKITLLKNFYDFILLSGLSEYNLHGIIQKIIEKYNIKDIDINLKDILMKIKIEIVLEFFIIKERYIKDVIIKCIENGWNLPNIKYFYIELKEFLPIYENVNGEKLEEKIKIENSKKMHIYNSVSSIVSSFPINYSNLNLKTLDFSNIENISRDFYLLLSGASKINPKNYDTDEILIKLKNQNISYFTKEKIEQFSRLIYKAKYTKKPDSYKEWIKHFKSYDFNSKEKYDYIAEAIGVISHALEKLKIFPLRDEQILAILILIEHQENQDNNKEQNNKNIVNNKKRNRNNLEISDKNRGIIEQILPGEGKSIIISCLSIYYCLRNHKVDIITSTSDLANRDTYEFKELYKIFDLIVDCTKDSQPAPYLADILYGTFLDFEVDLLYEMIDNKNIRFNRPYDIIIIDDIDITLIERLNDSTKFRYALEEYHLLIYIYLYIYLMMEIIDNIPLEEFKKLSNKNSEINEKIENNTLKNIKISYIQNKFKEIRRNFFFLPKYLNDFAEIYIDDWINSAFKSQELKKEIDYTIIDKKIISIDKNTKVKTKFSSNNGLQQMLQIKENLEVEPNSLTLGSVNHITYINKFQKKNIFGLTGILGEKEIYFINNNNFLQLDLIFIPPHSLKKFIELPPIICNNESHHLNKICEEIFYHFSKGRKIIIICEESNKAKNIDNFLSKKYDQITTSNVSLILKDDIYIKKNWNKKIIITTNFESGNIPTNTEEEKNGGLHIIIAESKNNLWKKKKIFDRIYYGKKGSGQLIINEKEDSKVFEKLFGERNKNENEMMNELNKININKFNFQDQLLQEYWNFLKKYPELKNDKYYNIKYELQYKWSMFLLKNFNCDINQSLIKTNFINLKSEIDIIMGNPEHHEFNKFFGYSNAFNFKNNEKISYEEIYDILNFVDCNECIFFATSYYKGLIKWFEYRDSFINNDNKTKENHCKQLIEYLNISKKQIEKFIEINILPIFELFKIIQRNEYYANKENSSVENIYKLIDSRKNILLKLIEHINRNIEKIKKYIYEYLSQTNNSLFLNLEYYSKEIEFKKCLELNDEKSENLYFILNLGIKLLYTFKFDNSPKLKGNSKNLLILLLQNISK